MEQIDKRVGVSGNDLEVAPIGNTLNVSSLYVLWKRFKYQVSMIKRMSAQSVLYLLTANQGCSQ